MVSKISATLLFSYGAPHRGPNHPTTRHRNGGNKGLYQLVSMLGCALYSLFPLHEKTREIKNLGSMSP